MSKLYTESEIEGYKKFINLTTHLILSDFKHFLPQKEQYKLRDYLFRIESGFRELKGVDFKTSDDEIMKQNPFQSDELLSVAYLEGYKVAVKQIKFIKNE